MIIGLVSLQSYSQTVNDVPVSQLDADYIQIVGTQKLLSTQVTIQIDYGQRDKVWKASDTQVKDAEGRLVVLNSMIDALNFMSENGYEFVDAYVITISNQNVYHYMMRKKR